jgi:hypothetical protein
VFYRRKKIKIPLLAALALLILAAGFMAAPAAEAAFSYSENNLTISTSDDLKLFRESVEKGDDYAGKTVTLAADIVYEGWAGFIGNANTKAQIGDKTNKAFSGRSTATARQSRSSTRNWELAKCSGCSPK